MSTRERRFLENSIHLHLSEIIRRIPLCELNCVAVVPFGGLVQCVWQSSWAAAELHFTERDDSEDLEKVQKKKAEELKRKMEIFHEKSLKEWYCVARGDGGSLNQFPEQREGFSKAVSVEECYLEPLLGASYHFNTPCLLIENNILSELDNADKKITGLGNAVRKWLGKAPKGRVIVVGLVNDRKKTKTNAEILHKEVQFPIYFACPSDAYGLQDKTLRGIGVIAYLQKRHYINLFDKWSLCVYGTECLRIAANEEVGMKSMRCANVYSDVDNIIMDVVEPRTPGFLLAFREKCLAFKKDPYVEYPLHNDLIKNSGENVVQEDSVSFSHGLISSSDAYETYVRAVESCEPKDLEHKKEIVLKSENLSKAIIAVDEVEKFIDEKKVFERAQKDVVSNVFDFKYTPVGDGSCVELSGNFQGGGLYRVWARIGLTGIDGGTCECPYIRRSEDKRKSFICVDELDGPKQCKHVAGLLLKWVEISSKLKNVEKVVEERIESEGQVGNHAKLKTLERKKRPEPSWIVKEREEETSSRKGRKKIKSETNETSSKRNHKATAKKQTIASSSNKSERITGIDDVTLTVDDLKKIAKIILGDQIKGTNVETTSATFEKETTQLNDLKTAKTIAEEYEEYWLPGKESAPGEDTVTATHCDNEGADIPVTASAQSMETPGAHGEMLACTKESLPLLEAPSAANESEEAPLCITSPVAATPKGKSNKIPKIQTPASIQAGQKIAQGVEDMFAELFDL
eukprot:Nk52_evm27s356 gene=Nk52_evmTU27s356